MIDLGHSHAQAWHESRSSGFEVLHSPGFKKDSPGYALDAPRLSK